MSEERESLEVDIDGSAKSIDTVALYVREQDTCMTRMLIGIIRWSRQNLMNRKGRRCKHG